MNNIKITTLAFILLLAGSNASAGTTPTATLKTTLTGITGLVNIAEYTVVDGINLNLSINATGSYLVDVLSPDIFISALAITNSTTAATEVALNRTGWLGSGWDSIYHTESSWNSNGVASALGNFSSLFGSAETGVNFYFFAAAEPSVPTTEFVSDLNDHDTFGAFISADTAKFYFNAPPASQFAAFNLTTGEVIDQSFNNASSGVPTPSILLLMAAGLFGLRGISRRK